MAGTISESYLSRPFNVGVKSTSRELIYDIHGTDDEGEVQTLILGVAPAVYNGLILDSVEAEPVFTDSGSSTGLWKGKARYILPEVEYTFDTGGGQQKVTQSYFTVNSYSATGFPAPDFQGAIGVSEDSVEGCEVPSPKYDFTETHLFDDVDVSSAYKTVLFNLTGRKNGGTFKGLAAGACLFLGATGSNRGTGQWSITFRFSGSPNVSGLTIGTITGIDKLGWDYLWIRYGDYSDGTAFSLVKRPEAVYVERVILDGDMSTLLIGV